MWLADERPDRVDSHFILAGVDTLTGMRVFTATVDGGSFAAAADRMNLSRAMASKYVAHLEARLNTRLLQRSTRKLALTDAGLAFYDRCVHILDDITEAEQAASRQSVAAHGLLRLTMPVSFGNLHMGPLLSAYLKQYPSVQVNVQLTDRRVNLIEEGIDLALRIGALSDSDLVARKLATDELVITGSAQYLRESGTPTCVADLRRHNCLLFTYASGGDEWTIANSAGVSQCVKVTGNFQASNGDLIKEIVLEGTGLMCQPLFLCAREIREGRLTRVLADHDCGEVGIYAVYPSRKYLSAKVRLFIDMLANELSSKRLW